MYACPNCGGGLKFDITSQKLKCDYCATFTDPYDISKDKDAGMETDEYGVVHPISGDTGIFIYPGYKFKAVDSLITNFHLPKSTLLMLVSALWSRENILSAYETAVKEGYRFFSFGDAMLIK